jgi:cell fate regulator YaaT (PSP1 superfamily)
MPIYGLKLGPLGQTNYYSSEYLLRAGDGVLIETEHGLVFAVIASGPLEKMPGIHTQLHGTDGIESCPSRIPPPLPPVLRQATSQDWEKERQNRELAGQAAAFCRCRIAERNPDMKLIDVEVFFDRSKIIFYFTAPSRIDFRNLVKELVQEYRTRIELRQIGVRHETQMVGAVGNCGMVCCCQRYLRKFASVTIRMAKEQNLFLNPAKISGICGRLLCCLAYEQDNYDHFHRACPRLGKKYQTSQGNMKILRASMFRNSLVVLTEDNEEKELSLEAWQALSPKRAEGQKETPRAENSPQAGTENSLLVFSAAPDTLAALDFDEFFDMEKDPAIGLSQARPQTTTTASQPPVVDNAQPPDRQRHRRKRKRPQQRPT